MNICIPLVIVTSTLVNLSITLARLTEQGGNKQMGDMSVLCFPFMNISIPGAILTSTLVNLSITLARLNERGGKDKIGDISVLGLPPYSNMYTRLIVVGSVRAVVLSGLCAVGCV